MKKIADSVELGPDVAINDFVNLYGCRIGAETKIGPFVEIQKNASVGARCKISSHSFICEGVTIEDEVFIGHGVMFTNDIYPRAVAASGELQTEADWQVIPTLIKKRGVHWIKCDHHLRDNHRPGQHDRRRQCGDQRRPR